MKFNPSEHAATMRAIWVAAYAAEFVRGYSATDAYVGDQLRARKAAHVADAAVAAAAPHVLERTWGSDAHIEEETTG